MSFSSATKAEICRVPLSRKCCCVAEASGILLYCNKFSPNEIRIMTESRDFSSRLIGVFRKAFGVSFDEIPESGEKKGKLIYKITDREKVEKVYLTLGYDEKGAVSHMINFGCLEDECCRTSFVRGAFLSGGSVTDPGKGYHLEFTTNHYNVGRGMMAVLLEMGFYPKDVARKGNYVTYFKQSEAIEDLLTTIGAPLAAMEIMNAKVEKGMRNSVQRQVNCDTANVEKSVEAAQDQISAIRHLEKAVGLENLPEKLQEIALLRIFNPEASLSELAKLSNPSVSKSTVNYRMKKILEMSLSYNQEREKEI